MIGYYIENSTSFPVYTYGEIVLRSSPTPVYYVKWSPSNISGTFIDNNSTYRLEDYSGYFELYSNYIVKSAFNNNTDITSIETNVEYIGDAFESCYNLSRLSAPNCVGIAGGAFYGCSALESVILPRFTGGTQRFIFTYCTSLSYVYMPVCTFLYSETFMGCEALTSVSLPQCSRIYPYCFRMCYGLESIDLPACERISHGVFWSCYSLSKVILRYSSVVYLERYSVSGDTTFTDTLIASGRGGIYVPSSLVAAYKAESRWSSLSSYIYPINN